MKRLIFVLLVLMFSVSLVSSFEITDIFKQNEDNLFSFVCKDEFTGLPCASSFNCNITMYYPNGTILMDNEPTTRINFNYNVTIPDVSNVGLHKYTSFCTNGTNGGVSQDLYISITPTGTELSASQGIIYFVILLLSFALFLICLFGSIVIPFKNIKSPDGFIIDINVFKYLKVTLWLGCYLLLLWISFILWNIGEAFLFFDISVIIFKVIFLILAWAIVPLFPLFILIVILSLLKDSEVKEQLERGIQI